MISHQYYYFLIRPSTESNIKAESAYTVDFLTNELGLRQVGNLEFREQQDKPWTSLSLVYASEDGSYASGLNPESFNLIVINASKDHAIKEYIDFLSPLAKHLNWELIEEGGDENNDVILCEAT